MTITAGTKDWTWVLRRPCPACRYDAAETDPRTVAAEIRGHAARWTAALARPDAAVRPSPDVWSPVEYAAHVRDTFGVFTGRVRMMRDVDAPAFDDWNQDAAAITAGDDRLAAWDVEPGLLAAIETMAAELDAVPAGDWRRSGRRSNGSKFTIATLTQDMLHDDVHHLHDVGA